MLKLASPSSTVHFTSLSPISCQTLPSILDRSAGPSSASYKVTSDTILQMLASSNPPTPISAVCLLDPRAEKPLAPEDRHLFKYFLFGGILGDDPPRYRTGELKKMGFEGRHLGDIQMTTDTALGVTKLVVDDGIPLDQIPYVVCTETLVFRGRCSPSGSSSRRITRPSRSTQKNPSKCRSVSHLRLTVD